MSRARTAGFHITGSALAVLFLLPMLWTLYSSVHGRRAADGGPGWGVDNYERLADYGTGLGTYLLNTVVVAGVAVVVTVVTTTLGGYALARLRFPGHNLLFLVTLAILMVPYTTILVPLYILLGWIGLQNSLVGLGLVLAMFQLPFGLFMMRSSFEALPRELEEAALIDGCTPGSALWRVLLRGVLPGIVTVGLFSFLAAWNEFVAPLIFLTDGAKFTLPVALFNLQSGSLGSVDFEALQAGVVTSALPCVVVFLLLQRHYVRGFTSGALKG
ncbi:multiple sugar transport system permease protein [Saccharothrix ecbatanensis]|jgi:multiple sugar transport system permease protein|uniref:Multiple sugar transport system permease protein n=1 Tax=Saccharothrix ecbatanensis TaxID=1105145 RepID=A0A7W9HI04_9PSEU|nr:carbohydrate ABC transporter permease [Saccharothrix ecbatanensis]MBB5802697.1 multiple sugar transport system permease protein [Saccharothrix ecbatanensis]